MRANALTLKRIWPALLLLAAVVASAGKFAAAAALEEVTTQGLSGSEIESILKAAPVEEQQRLFNRLTPDQKVKAFQHLSPKQQLVAFKWLTNKEKEMVFATLDENAKSDLFARLGEPDQEFIFKGLEDQAKAQILTRLSMEKRSLWLARYPGLRLLISDETRAERQGEGLQPKKARTQEKEKPSRIERIMSGIFPQSIERHLTQFGYDFFSATPPAFTPISGVPVGEDYILGPEDAFTIHLWGKVEASYPVVVSSEGTIVVPRIGSLTVGDLKLKAARQLLRRKFKEYYQDFSMSFTMDRLRAVQVFVVGEVERPGTYNVSGMSTVIDALYAAGGLRKTGSLRSIKVTRNGGTVATVDLYTFLIEGRKVQDIRLHPGDTVFVPVIGPVAGIAGNVRRPAIYEIQDHTTIGQLLELAGGVMPTGYLQNVVIERIENNRRRIVKSFNLEAGRTPGKDQMSTRVEDGDVVKVFPVYRQMQQVVFLEGHVKYPREYEYWSGMRVSDLIPSYEQLLPEPYLKRAEIIRLVPPDLHPEIIGFNLGALLAGDESQNILLKDMDRVMVYDKAEKKDLPQVTITGAVRQPGTYRLYQGMRVKDLIFKADNLLPGAYTEKASLSRMSLVQDRTDVVTIDFSPAKAIAGDPADDIELKPFDSVYIREIPRYSEVLDRKITLEGEFKFPGEYTFSEGERLSSVIARAGGFTEEAYPFGAVYLREDVKVIQQKRIQEYVSGLEEEVLALTSQAAETSLEKDEADIILKTLTAKKQLLEKMKKSQPSGRMVVNLAKVVSDSGSDQDPKVQPGDRLIVKKRPDYVNVLGEVYNPTALLVAGERRVGYYLNLVGGSNDNADEDQIYLVKANGTVISKRQEGFWGMASWDGENHRWTLGGFENVKVDPGDSIIVPKKVEKYPWLRVVKTVTEIMYQIAVAAGVLIVAY